MDRKISLAVRQKRLWTTDEDKLLGKLPDSEIATRLKRSIKSVQARRLEKGIASPSAFRPWTDEEESSLGKISDTNFARKFGRSISRVKRRRIQLGIRVFNSRRHDWTAEDDKLLGVRTDQDIAALLGTTVEAVQHRRSQFGIAPCARQMRQTLLAKSKQLRRAGGHFGKYDPNEDKLMGTMPDRELALRLGRTHKAVEARRIHLGIPKFDPRIHKWTAEEDALLGVEADGQIASRLGLSISAVAHRRRRLGRGVLFGN